MDRAGFQQLAERLGAAWTRGDATGAAACFNEAVDYADPRRYRFTSRDALEQFFDPGPEGHALTWHRILFDEAAQTGVLEYTYEGQHRYHGAAVAEVNEAGLICTWREWQHLDDARDWEAFLKGSE
jgi:hypothetical protein